MRGESPGVSSRPHTHTQDNSTGIGPSTTSTALRDCSTSRSVAHTREAEPESSTRAAVRWAFRDYPDQMPHLPASQEPKRRMKGYEQPPINRVLGALLSAGCDYRPAKSVDEWEAHCPTHQDSHPSLVVRRNGDGSVWLKCWGGCPKEAILDALGLEWRDLWDASEHDPGRRHATRERPLLAPHLRRAMEDLLRMDDERRTA